MKTYTTPNGLTLLTDWSGGDVLPTKEKIYLSRGQVAALSEWP